MSRIITKITSILKSLIISVVLLNSLIVALCFAGEFRERMGIEKMPMWRVLNYNKHFIENKNTAYGLILVNSPKCKDVHKEEHGASEPVNVRELMDYPE